MSDQGITPTSATGGKCQATTKSGSACRAKPLQGQPFCILHADPTGSRARELGRKGGKANIRVKPDPNPPEIPPLQTATQVRDFIAQVMADVRAHRLEARTAATLASLATSQLRAISAAELEARVERLEKKVNEASVAEGPQLPSIDEWLQAFGYLGEHAPTPVGERLPQLAKHEPPQRKLRSMPEDWTVPERRQVRVLDHDSIPLNQ
jgi:hypothetical protein